MNTAKDMPNSASMTMALVLSAFRSRLRCISMKVGPSRASVSLSASPLM